MTGSKGYRMAAAPDIKNELIKGIIHIARTWEYFGHVIQQFEKVYVRNPHAIDTAAVGRFPGERFIKLWLNLDCYEEFYQKFGKETAWLFMVGDELHEILHVVSGHLSLEFPDHLRGNVACDMAVISHMPESMIHPNRCNAEKYGLPKGKSAAWYYDQLRDNKMFQKQLKDGCFGIGGLLEYIGKSHQLWKELLKDPVTKEFIKDILRKAKDLTNNGYGNIPGDLAALIEEGLKRGKAIVPWGQVLRMFCASAQESVLDYTMMRVSKRFGTRPGTRKGDVLNLAVAVDTSGSISEEQLALFFNEIRWVWKNGATVTVYEADCAVCRSYSFRGKFTGEVHGRGGTDLEPVLKEVEGKYDALIYFTDFYAPKIEKVYRIPTLWVLTTELERKDFPVQWGRHIKIEGDRAKAA